MDLDATLVFGTVVTLGGGVILYLRTEVSRLRRQKSILEKIVFENREAMDAFMEVRKQDERQPWDG